MHAYGAELDVPHALVEWVTLLIVTREGDRRCKLLASSRALAGMVHLRQNNLRRSKPGSGATWDAHTYVRSVVALLAVQAPA